MKLLIRQRIFTLTDNFNVYDENGDVRYEVNAEFFSLGHKLHVYEKASGREIGAIHEKLFTLLPTFEIVVNGQIVGTIRRKFTFFRENYEVDYRGWDVEGDFMGWDYRVLQGERQVLSITKELFNWSDTYVLNFTNPADEIPGLLLVIAIDAANCSRNKN